MDEPWSLVAGIFIEVVDGMVQCTMPDGRVVVLTPERAMQIADELTEKVTEREFERIVQRFD